VATFVEFFLIVLQIYVFDYVLTNLLKFVVCVQKYLPVQLSYTRRSNHVKDMKVAPRRYSDDLGVEIVDFVFFTQFSNFHKTHDVVLCVSSFFSFGFKFTHKHHHKLV
jgi:hypothetical protein